MLSGKVLTPKLPSESAVINKSLLQMYSYLLIQAAFIHDAIMSIIVRKKIVLFIKSNAFCICVSCISVSGQANVPLTKSDRR